MNATRFVFDRALCGGRWRNDVSVEVGADGVITRVGAAKGAADSGTVASDGERSAASDDAAEVRVRGIAVPGMANVHSHAFQRVMAGTAETRGRPDDSFWTWRERMYQVAGAVTPEDLGAIARFAYGEMLRAGYTAVGEFHYLHHDVGGRRYADPAEMSRRVVAAAAEVGIALCHLPVLYAFGGFGGAPTGPGQARFVHGADDFVGLLREVNRDIAERADARLGVAFHSLRAVDAPLLRSVLDAIGDLDGTAPVHIHIAEQQREVAAARRSLGARPVRWLLDNAPVDKRWCLVHATHLDDGEVRDLARSGAVAGLCPTTEANLGDGLFPAATYLARGGRIGIGSDSHVALSPTAELRLLEYGQRLQQQRRALLCSSATPSVGRTLYDAARGGGAAALGLGVGDLAPGQRADLVVLDPDHPTLWEATGDAILDRWIFADVGNPVRDVLVGGRWRVRDRRLVGVDESAVARDYRAALSRLSVREAGDAGTCDSAAGSA